MASATVYLDSTSFQWAETPVKAVTPYLGPTDQTSYEYLSQGDGTPYIFATQPYPQNGVIQGSTLVEGELTANLLVRLYHRASGSLVAETRSNASGVFSFTGLAEVASAYYVLGFDPEGGYPYNAKVFDLLTPVPALPWKVLVSAMNASLGGMCGVPSIFIKSGGFDLSVNNGYLDYSNGARTLTSTDSNLSGRARSVNFITGKTYWEVKMVYRGNFSLTVKPAMGLLLNSVPAEEALGATLATGWALFPDGNYYNATLQGASGVGNVAVNDVVMFAVDPAAGKLWFGKNGTWVGDPVAGTGATFTNIPVGATTLRAAVELTDKEVVTANFMAAHLVYSPPSGFVSLA